MQLKTIPFTLVGIILLSAVSAAENPDNQIIKSEQQLGEYCRYLIEEVYRSSNKTATNWQITTKRKDTQLSAKVKYRVNDSDITAVCKIKAGQQAKATEFSFVEQ